MTTHFRLLALSLLFCLPVGASAFAQDCDSVRFADYYIEVMEDMGYNPEYDKDCDLKFKRFGENFYLDLYPTDTHYSKIMYFFDMEVNKPKLGALFFILFQHQSRYKSISAQIYGDVERIMQAKNDKKTGKVTIVISSESILGVKEAFGPVFERQMEILEAALGYIRDDLRGLAESEE